LLNLSILDAKLYDLLNYINQHGTQQLHLNQGLPQHIPVIIPDDEERGASNHQ
jgi:hypothetical protein